MNWEQAGAVLERRGGVPLEAIISESGWIRALARRLVRDDASADDVVQQTYIAALETPLDERTVRGWLKTVVRNFSFRKQRDEQRRHRRELAAARPDTHTPVDLVDRIELQRRIAKQVLDLREPYRSTVILHFYEELSSTEIARRQGVPAATVRGQLRRGLAALREAFDEECGGDRSQWIVGVAVLARPLESASVALSTTTAVSVLGVISMKVALQIVAVVGVVALLWISIDPFGSGASQRDDVSARSDDVDHRATTATTSDVERGTPSVRGRTSVSDDREAKVRPPDAAAIGGVSDTTIVTARVVDESDQPIAGARLQHSANWYEFEPQSGAVSDVDGVATYRVSGLINPLYRQFRATGVGFATQFLKSVELTPGEVHDLGSIVMEPGSTVSGVVVDGVGNPVADALVYVMQPKEDRDEPRRGLLGPGFWSGVRRYPTRSGFDGSFLIEGAPPGAMHVAANQLGYRWGYSDSLTVDGHTSIDGLTISLAELASDERIDGRVLSPDGSPAPGAWLKVRTGEDGGLRPRWQRSDGRGFFTLPVEPDETYAVQAQDSERTFTPVELGGVRPGESITLKLLDELWIDLAVTLPAGSEVWPTDPRWMRPSIKVWREGEEWSYQTLHSQPIDFTQATQRLQAHAEPFSIGITVPGFRRVSFGPFDYGSAPSTLECLLEPLAVVSGVVRFRGEPIEGARVSLKREYARNTKVSLLGFVQRFMAPSDPESNATTDVDGRFRLAVTERETYFVQVWAKEYPSPELESLELGPSLGRENWDIDIPEPGRLEGRVVAPPGKEFHKIEVQVSRGDMRTHRANVEDNGSFVVEGLGPGSWMISTAVRTKKSSGMMAGEIHEEQIDGEVVFPWAFEIRPGKTTVYTLDLGAVAPARPASRTLTPIGG